MFIASVKKKRYIKFKQILGCQCIKTIPRYKIRKGQVKIAKFLLNKKNFKFRWKKGLNKERERNRLRAIPHPLYLPTTTSSTPRQVCFSPNHPHPPSHTHIRTRSSAPTTKIHNPTQTLIIIINNNNNKKRRHANTPNSQATSPNTPTPPFSQSYSPTPQPPMSRSTTSSGQQTTPQPSAAVGRDRPPEEWNTSVLLNPGNNITHTPIRQAFFSPPTATFTRNGGGGGKGRAKRVGRHMCLRDLVSHRLETKYVW